MKSLTPETNRQNHGINPFHYHRIMTCSCLSGIRINPAEVSRKTIGIRLKNFRSKLFSIAVDETMVMAIIDIDTICDEA